MVDTPITNWTGTLVQKGTVFGAPISFNDGILNINGTPALFTGTYDGDALTAQVVLTANQSIRIDSGQFVEKIVALRGSNRLEGQPIFTQSNAIALGSVFAGLTLAVNAPVSTSIVLNGGILTLEDNVMFTAGNTITGSGTINANGRRLSFAGPLTGFSLGLTQSILLVNAQDIDFNGPMSLSGTWTFAAQGTGSQPRILGHGNTLDLTQRGSIYVQKNTILRLNDLKIKGLGRGGFVLQDKTSQVRLSRVEIEMANSYTVTSGGIYVDGGSTIVTKDKLLTLSLRASLTVDGVTLWYDPASSTDNSNIRPSISSPLNPGNKLITYLNGGVINGVADNVDLRATSNALLFINRTSSNALLFSNRNNSNAIIGLGNIVRTNSNAAARGIRNNSNALLFGDRTNSNAIIGLGNTVRTNSNAAARGIRNNSNTILSIYPSTSGSLIGVSNVVYMTNHGVFHDGQFVKGFVRINNGFSIDPAASVLFDTFITVSGGIDLKDTGILNLNNDLRLESGVTFSNGGIISGRGHSVVLGSALRLTPTTNVRVLTIRSDTVFDGCGKPLIIGDRSQIFVENNITLTLRNLVLQTGKFSQTPPIRLASLGSKLALDNVVVELGSDFDFRQGQIFVHNDVEFCGTSALVYRSPRPSYITSGGLLTFDKGTTFSMAPASFTDALFTNVPTTTSSKFLVMQDVSSALFMNGSSLATTYTGLRLTKGNLFLDNHVVFNSVAAMDLSSLTSIGNAPTGGGPTSVQWSPDGRYILLSNSNASNTFQVYSFDGVSAPTAVGSAVPTGAIPFSVAWSPNGRYIVAGAYGAVFLQTYSFSGNSTPVQIGGNAASGVIPAGVTWSPDSRFIAIASRSGSAGLQIYRFNGNSTATTVGSIAGFAGADYVDWSPDGRYLALVSENTSNFQIFSFDGANTPVAVGPTVTLPGLSTIVKWSPDGRYIALTCVSTGSFQIYKFDGINAPKRLVNAVFGSSYGIDWSPDGRYIALLLGNSVRIFHFDGNSSLTPVFSTSVGSFLYSVAWSPNGQYIAFTDYNNNLIHVYKVNFTNTTTPQAFSQSIVFGDSRIGSGANLNVGLLGGANVEVLGKINEDGA